jgi:hypothetical protein
VNKSVSLSDSEVSEFYQIAIQQAKHFAIQHDCDCYIVAKIKVQGLIPYIYGFGLSDWYDSSCCARVNVSKSGAVSVIEI